jgi:para-nitrobenzyl esterase
MTKKLLLGALMLCLSLAGRAEEPVAQTEAGPVHGQPIGKGALFRAIPYAMPPLGALRWKPPEPVRPASRAISGGTPKRRHSAAKTA